MEMSKDEIDKLPAFERLRILNIRREWLDKQRGTDKALAKRVDTKIRVHRMYQKPKGRERRRLKSRREYENYKSNGHYALPVGEIWVPEHFSFSCRKMVKGHWRRTRRGKKLLEQLK